MTPFEEIVREKVPLLVVKSIFFNSLKQAFFYQRKNKEKKSKPFKRPFLRKQEKCLMMAFHYIYKYSQVHNTKTIFFELFKNTLLTSSHCKLHNHRFIENNHEPFSIQLKIYPFFTKFQVKNTPILQFREICFKIPLFSWNVEHT